jgi:hypothetical protein
MEYLGKQLEMDFASPNEDRIWWQMDDYLYSSINHRTTEYLIGPGGAKDDLALQEFGAMATLLKMGVTKGYKDGNSLQKL